MGKQTRRLWALVFSLVIGTVIYLGNTPPALAFTEEQKLLLQSWRLVNQAYLDETFNHQNWWLLREKYVKRPLRDREETYTAIEEMLATLDEPFTRLLRPEQYGNLQVTTTGELSGVGLQININPETNQLEIMAPLAGSPAEEAGLQPHDQILAIDGVDTQTLSLDEAAARMRGPKNTKVSLEILPAGTEVPEKLTLTRQLISLSPVVARLDDSRPGQSVGYIRLSQFSANAYREVVHALHHLENQGADGYILDLRNNPGGLLQAGIDIARLWLPESTIVYTVNRQGTQESFTASGEAVTDRPLVVLVNQGTASASEILAGALQDNHRATLLGEKTFGKGLIQSLFELSDGAGIAITVAKYETPEHHDIHKLGIMPDEVVEQPLISFAEITSPADVQYQAALDLLTGGTAIANKSPSIPAMATAHKPN
ncbi:S41 family peptidase [Synechocystis sp. PCC 7339]|uniref:carboxyl-terminal processing protease CtpA n=1 Tax=unclassified Synechocystis TaxID=2640012 RepID=UPI001BAEBB72|nr:MULTISPECIES: carboxyl-terminal processing protease CtpA [unclassified Synechocystis]QUS59726.1 S41 family peptidase [Synechocystis sp. PCC 7338]UAJ71927.1 S41 family peptidase [Synechocystis sp. PCC 7339]